jgi:hypothetical protein
MTDSCLLTMHSSYRLASYTLYPRRRARSMRPALSGSPECELPGHRRGRIGSVGRPGNKQPEIYPPSQVRTLPTPDSDFTDATRTYPTDFTDTCRTTARVAGAFPGGAEFHSQQLRARRYWRLG